MRWVVKTESFLDGVIFCREERWFDHYGEAVDDMNETAFVVTIGRQGTIEKSDGNIVLVKRDGAVIAVIGVSRSEE